MLFFQNFFFIKFQTLLNYLHRFLMISKFLDFDGFVLKFFINFQKVHQFLEDVVRQFADVLVTVVLRVAIRNCNDFFVPFASVRHGHNSNRIASDKAQSLKRLGAEDKDVERVLISTICERNKAVIHWVVRAGVQNSVHNQTAGFFVEFIFCFVALLNFNASQKIFRFNAIFAYIFPNIHFCSFNYEYGSIKRRKNATFLENFRLFCAKNKIFEILKQNSIQICYT